MTNRLMVLAWLDEEIPAMTSDELDALSNRVASGLVASGVRPGDHVGLLMANLPDFVAIKFGIARAGAVAVPINFLNRQDELGYVLGQSDAVFLFTMDRFRDLDYLGFLDGLAPGWETAGGGSRFPRLRTIVVLPGTDAPVRPGIRTFDAFCRSAGPLPVVDHPGRARPPALQRRRRAPHARRAAAGHEPRHRAA